MFEKCKNGLANLGPGLLYAGAAIGVSHLIMSTQAGAKYQYLLILLIPLIHLVKYPFLRFGPEYTAVTGKNLLHGYNALGKWAIWTYIIMTLVTMCLIQAAVTIVTSSIAVNFFKLDIPKEYMPHVPAIICLCIAGIILCFGKYSLLDKTMKFIVILLTVTTIFALCSVFIKNPHGMHQGTPVFSFESYGDLMFLAAFLGWMPAPMDISIWHSVWSEDANESDGKRASLKKAMIDFRVGFYGTAFMGICFLVLGALLMFGGDKPSDNGVVFSGQLIKMYTDALGSWAYPIIGVAAITTMFSTTLTCLDAFPRTLEKSYLVLKNDQRVSSKKIYFTVLILAVVGTLIAFFVIAGNNKAMSIFTLTATFVSFVATIILATINYMVMKGKTVPDEHKPTPLIKWWCIIGIFILTVTSVFYLYVAFMMKKPQETAPKINQPAVENISKPNP